MPQKKQMTKVDAIRELYFEFTGKKRSKSALARLRRACEALGLNEEETRQAEYLADYRPAADLDTYNTFQ